MFIMLGVCICSYRSTSALFLDFVFHLQNTMMLRAIPGLKEVGKALLGIEHLQFTFEL